MFKKVLIVSLATCLYAINVSAQTTRPTDSTLVFKIADSATYTGKYKYEVLPFDYMTITVKDNQLYFFGGEYSGFLLPVKNRKDAFDAHGQALFTFLRNDDGKVNDLQIDYQGQQYTGKRDGK